ncbi:radical SAM/SPASM domain-containing protein [Rugamonas rivuli]|uniref:Radical SAM protein n=1 Tax=Rugamonas rivuli TaxID=2743358 RepID=A0A843SKE0_9BURK|nr:radical SAM/SPASM domain-containing protein [Rugamonas rivuli]MQA21207.1 radical SAM protein [Rugamonas rivuli]
MIKIHLQNDSAAAAPPLPVTEARPAPVNDWAVQPEVFFLELTNHCNMHCTFCPSDYLKKERGNADDELAVRFIEEVRDLGLNKPIQFNVLGEPLLNKKIYKYIDLCEQYGIEVYLISNFAILDAERAKKIFQHDNVALVLSLQTPTEDSYKRMRGYDKLNFEQYFDRIFPALREKFAAGSESRVEVHVTSTSNMRADSTIQSDFDLNMWDPFDVEDKDAFVLNLLNRFDGFSEQLRAEFPEQFEAERVRSLEQYAEQLGRNHLAASRDTIPDGAIDMTEDQFWGYMFAPNCFIRFKTFGLWTKEETFMKTFLPKESVVYVEEREEALDCSMAHNVSMLADGQMSLCCLDYEGEMGLPNMRDTSIVELLRAPEREAIAKDSMKSEVCRRCQGNIFVFDSEAKDERATKFDKFGRGWHPFEPDMNGVGGRWSNGNGWLYFLARQDSNLLNLRIMSIYDSATPLTVQVREHDEASKQFGEVLQQQVFFGVQNQMIDAQLPVSLKQGQLYRVDLLSPTFVPAEANGGDDRRSLGIMLFEAGVRQGELQVAAPVAEPEPVPQPEPVVVAEAGVASGGRFKRWLSALTGKP